MLVTGWVLHVDIIVGVPGLVPRALQPRPHEGAGLDQLPRLRLPDGDVVLQQTCQPCLTMFGSESSINNSLLPLGRYINMDPYPT